MTPRTRLATAAAGLLLLVGAPAAWYLAQPDDQVGDPGLAATQDGRAGDTDDRVGEAERAPTPDGSPDAAADTAELGDTAETGDASGTTDAASGDNDLRLEPRAGELAGPLRHVPPPQRLEIPSLDVTAPLVPVSVEEDGSMEIPDDVDVVGWYEPGARPGQEGTAVLSGHVDSREQGPGVLFDLRAMDVGDTITTIGDDGEPLEWRVVARARYGKAELPISDIFVREGPSRLVVITCGGDFDPVTRSYSDNVVVYAEPA